MRIETFLFTHPIRVVIQDQNLQFVGEKVKGYLPTVVREFYSNLSENHNIDTLLETIILGKQLMVSPDSIARSLNYVRPVAHDRPYPLKAITEFESVFKYHVHQPGTHGGLCAQGVHPGEIKA